MPTDRADRVAALLESEDRITTAAKLFSEMGRHGETTQQQAAERVEAQVAAVRKNAVRQR